MEFIKDVNGQKVEILAQTNGVYNTVVAAIGTRILVHLTESVNTDINDTIDEVIILLSNKIFFV